MKFAIFGNKHQTSKSKSIERLFDVILRNNDIFAIDDIRSAYDFVKDAKEWYVDVYENFVGENYAEFTGFAVVSWKQR